MICDKTRSLQPGQLLARGVSRLLASYDIACVQELVPARGLRVDIMGLSARSEIWIIECKSCTADFRGDSKWQGYLEWCDRFFWAVNSDFPVDLLPDDNGLIVADGYGGEIMRMGSEQKLPPARRKAIVQKFGMTAARRLHQLRDPEMQAVLS
jgi:hypothetical protein